MWQRHAIVLIALLAALLRLEKIESATPCRLKFTGLKCEVLDKTAVNVSVCRLKAIKRDVSEITVWVQLLKKPVNNISVAFKLRQRGYEHAKPLLEYSFDACAFLDQKNQNPLSMWFYNTLGFARFSNMNHSCPYDHDLIFNKYRFDRGNYFGLISIPSDHYTLFTVWSTYNKPAIKVDINLIISSYAVE